jgi:DNA-binding ferritin-like protein (Dps family)
MSKVEDLIKKNYELSRKLTPENDEIYTNIVCYLRTSVLDELEAEEIIQDIIGMFLEAQERGEEIEKVIGEDYQAFCDSIIEAAQPKNFTWRKLFSSLEIAIIAIAVLWLIDLAFDYLPQMIKQGRLILDYQVNLGFLITAAINLLAAAWIVNYIGKNSFKITNEQQQGHKWRQFVLLWAVMSGYIALLVFISLKLDSFILFTVKAYYFAAVIVVLYVLLRAVNGKLSN